jgi:hypothetical protein
MRARVRKHATAHSFLTRSARPQVDRNAVGDCHYGGAVAAASGRAKERFDPELWDRLALENNTL